MMRSLWTAASGMTSQQMNVDTISNNLANVNTTGYKKERMEFKTLLYQTIERASLDESNRGGKPLNLQVGLGVTPVVTSRNFTNGNFERTDGKIDFAIEGNGFFVIDRGDGNIAYTKDGGFKISIEDDEATLVTSEGYHVLNIDGEQITIPEDVLVDDIHVDYSGNFTYVDENNETQEIGTIDVVQFPNVQGLEAIGENLYVTTSASGEAIQESSGDINKVSKVVQGYLEMSNVAAVQEMVNLIVAQRAYDLNSKSIQASDDMLQQANNLKR